MCCVCLPEHVCYNGIDHICNHDGVLTYHELVILRILFCILVMCATAPEFHNTEAKFLPYNQRGLITYVLAALFLSLPFRPEATREVNCRDDGDGALGETC
jgi:hypothetical protein